MLKPLGRPRLAEEQKRDPYYVRLTKAEYEKIYSLFPDKSFSARITTIIDDYLKKYSELVTHSITEDGDLNVTTLKEGAECIAYQNRNTGEEALGYYKETSLATTIQGIINKQKLTIELFTNTIIPELTRLGYQVQVINPCPEIYGVWVLKPGDPCIQCKTLLKEKINALL